MTQQLKTVIQHLRNAGITDEGIKTIYLAIQAEYDHIEMDRAEIKRKVLMTVAKYVLVPVNNEQMNNEINQI